MINAVIVDDEPRGRNTIKMLIDAYCPKIHLAGMASSADEGHHLINETKPDLVFLDVEMPHKNGFDMLAMFSEISFDVIFTTAHDQYALRAIKIAALDYLLKPIEVDELINAVGKIEEKKAGDITGKKFSALLQNLSGDNRRKKIAIPDLEGYLFVYIDEIIRCESDSNYTYFFMISGQKITASRTLGEFEEMLTGERFFRVHRSHLINLDHVQRYIKGEGGEVVMDDKSHVTVSRRKKIEFLDLLSKI